MANKLTYDESQMPAIVFAVGSCNASLGQVADYCEIPRKTFTDWINQGDKDGENLLDTPLSRLSRNVRKEQALLVNKWVEEALRGRGSIKFLQWWLSVVFRKDFGTDAALINEMVEKLDKMEQNFKRYMDNPLQLQGVTKDGEAHNGQAQEDTNK